MSAATTSRSSQKNADPSAEAQLLEALLSRPGAKQAVSAALTIDVSKLSDLDTLGVTGLLPQMLGQAQVAAHITRPPDSPLVGTTARASGERLVLLGQPPDGLMGSQYLDVAHGLKTAFTAELDPIDAKALSRVLTTLVRAGVVTAAGGVQVGGLLATLSKLVLQPSGPELGIKVDLNSFGAVRTDSLLFGEAPGRVVLVVPTGKIGTVISEAHMGGVPATVIGETIKSPELSLVTRRVAAQWQIATLRAALNMARS